MENPIRKYREKQGVRQLDLALLLGVSEMTISHWERGARIPPEDILIKLAEVLKVNPKVLDNELVFYYEYKREQLKKKLGIQG